jgi:hypothetical protein
MLCLTAKGVNRNGVKEESCQLVVDGCCLTIVLDGLVQRERLIWSEPECKSCVELICLFNLNICKSPRFSSSSSLLPVVLTAKDSSTHNHNHPVIFSPISTCREQCPSLS